jgi:glycosyltransferase involved in cell wall biosynthesis
VQTAQFFDQYSHVWVWDNDIIKSADQIDEAFDASDCAGSRLLWPKHRHPHRDIFHNPICRITATRNQMSPKTLFLDRQEVLRTLWPQTRPPFRMKPDYQPALVSVIVPTHNRAGLISRCLESVGSQSYRPIELLVVDDGSTDSTAEVVEDFSRRRRDESFVVRYITQDNTGASAARNRGLIECNGEFIQFLDSDDVLHPRKLEIHVRAISAAPECDFVWSGYGEFQIGVTDPYFNDYDPAALVSGSTVIPKTEIFGITTDVVWTGLYRRSICLTTGPWNETLTSWEDIEYIIRFTSLAPTCRFVEAVLVSMGNHNLPRLGIRSKKVEGVEAGLTTLQFIENTLDAFQEPQGTRARNSVANFYLGLAKVALKNNAEIYIRPTFQGARRNRSDKFFRSRLTLLELIYKCFGPQLAGAVLESYSKFRLSH